MKRTMAMLLVVMMSMAAPAFADHHMAGGSNDYLANMQADFVRGLKNLVGAVFEIPITIQEYHEKEGKPVIRHVAGLVDGSFQGLLRAGSGAWDFVAAFLPGHQEGMPVEPETLF